MNVLFVFSHFYSSTRKLFLVVTLLVSFSAWAQNLERFALSHQMLGETNNFTTSTSSVSIGHRIFLDEEGANLFTFGIAYNQILLTDDTLSTPDKSRKLQSVVPILNLMKVIDEKYSMIAILRPGFYGDDRGSMGSDFRVEGGIVITKFMSDNLTMGLGLGRGTSLGRDLVVPLLQFLYFPSDKVLIRGLLPINASVWYIPSQKWEFGAVFSLQGSLYNIDETNIPDAQQLGFATANVGAATRYNMFGNSFIEAELGVTVLRRYEWVEKEPTSFDIGKEPLEEQDLDNTGYIRVGWLEKF